MNTTINDNSILTVSELNSLAIDLGATVFSAFDTTKFGVDKLNEITASLVTKGILSIGEKCLVVAQNSEYYVSSGVIVFASGAKIKIEEPIKVPARPGDKIYVVNDSERGIAKIETAAEISTQEDFVILASVNSDGTVKDLREMSIAKVVLSANVQNNYAEQEVDIQIGAAGTEAEVIPSLSQAQYIKLEETTWGDESWENRYYTVKLSENEQRLFYSGSPTTLRTVSVRKANGVLLFQGNHYTMKNQSCKLKFVLM